jgi:hypothetical protein
MPATGNTQRQVEFQQQRSVEAYQYQEMMANEPVNETNTTNTSHCQQPGIVGREQDDSYITRKSNNKRYAVLNPIHLLPAAWTNVSHNFFADLSIVGFPKVGTSHLYKLSLLLV